MVKTISLSGFIIYKKKGYYYSNKIKALLNIKNKNFNEYCKNRIKLGESKYFINLGKAFMEGIEKGLKTEGVV